jgi:predicted O-methyltransferase YrrM
MPDSASPEVVQPDLKLNTGGNGMQLIDKAPFNSRDAFGMFLEQRGARRGAEIGTHRGEFAYKLLERWRHGFLYCVDPYRGGYDDDDPASHGDRAKDRHDAHTRLQRFTRRSRFIETTSMDAARHPDLNDLDFVYVDAKHRFTDVLNDLTTWWNKLRPGGILAGHDIVCPGKSDPWGHEIQPAVFEFARQHRTTVMLVIEEQDEPWSYYMVKE